MKLLQLRRSKLCQALPQARQRNPFSLLQCQRSRRTNFKQKLCYSGYTNLICFWKVTL